MNMKKKGPVLTHETKTTHFFEVNELFRPKAKQINNELTVVRDLRAM